MKKREIPDYKNWQSLSEKDENLKRTRKVQWARLRCGKVEIVGRVVRMQNSRLYEKKENQGGHLIEKPGNNRDLEN